MACEIERKFSLPLAKIFFCVPSAKVTFTKALPSNSVLSCSFGTFVITPAIVQVLPSLPNFSFWMFIVNEPAIAGDFTVIP